MKWWCSRIFDKPCYSGQIEAIEKLAIIGYPVYSQGNSFELESSF